MSYAPLNAENGMQNLNNNQNFIVAFFFLQDGKKCLHKSKSSVLQCKSFICIQKMEYVSFVDKMVLIVVSKSSTKHI